MDLDSKWQIFEIHIRPGLALIFINGLNAQAGDSNTRPLFDGLFHTRIVTGLLFGQPMRTFLRGLDQLLRFRNTIAQYYERFH
jgi:hypothetical protein